MSNAPKQFSVAGLTGEERRRVLNARCRHYNAIRRQNPQEGKCACGKAGHLVKHGDAVCKRCDDLEQVGNQFWLRESRVRAEAALERGDLSQDEKREREIQEREAAIVDFSSSVLIGDDLIAVFGHGSYALPVEKITLTEEVIPEIINQ